MFWIIVALVGSLVISLRTLPPRTAQAQEPGVNLLRNGDFEEGAGKSWPFQGGIPEVQIAPGWRAFYVDNPPAYAKIPAYCADDPGCSYWRRPEFRGVSVADYAYRVHQGALAQKYFSFAGQHEAGLYQQVGGITPGVQLRFSAYMVTWSCAPSAERWNNCPTAPLSNKPAPMHAKVGIDPTGGTNPWSPDIVWSPELDATDNWTYFSVEAVATNVTVTVFTYTWADWVDQLFRVNNDVYLDTASLVVVDNPAPQLTEEVSPPSEVETRIVEYIPIPTATPLPDGSIVHTVREGDTLFAIAYDYRVPAEQIIALNALADPEWLSIGQELIISRPEGVTQAAATLESGAPPPGALTLSEPVAQNEGQSVASTGGKLCLLAFQDLNQDGVWQSEELLLPAITFTIRGAGGEPMRYTTNGVQEPYCLDALATGQYQVVAQAASGYRSTLGNAYLLLVDQSKPTDLAIGFVQDGTGSPASAYEETQESLPAENKKPSRLPLILGITTAVLLLAAGGVGFFVLHRR
ncbi:MAG: LysM peptidoglycan-binding domain-containing protein [Anaerolineae bacterium]